MAFLGDDEDAMRAFEAVLGFVDEFTVDAASFEASTAIDALTVQVPDENGAEMPSNGAPGNGTSRMSPGTSVLSTQTNDSATTAPPISEVARSKRRAADNARKKMMRKAGVYGNPNRARNERKVEIAYLKEKVGQLEAELQSLQAQPRNVAPSLLMAQSQESGDCAGASKDSTEMQVSSIWEGLADRQRIRREKAERENARLKLILESQIKVAKSLETLILKRAEQVAECSSSILRPGDVSCPPGRTLDFRADVSDFQELLQDLDDAYSRVDAILASTGLASMEMTQQDVHVREGVNGMYLEVFSNKVMPFGLKATAEAAWNYFKGSEKHRGNLYGKAAQNLDTPYTIIEHFSKALLAGNSSMDVRVKQVIRRYVEPDREVVVWVATIAPIEIKHKAFAGLMSHHRDYAVIKRAKASAPERELSLLQLVSHVSLDTKEGSIYDPKYIRALTDFLLSNAAGNIKADQELIENVLMDQKLQQHGV